MGLALELCTAEHVIDGHAGVRLDILTFVLVVLPPHVRRIRGEVMEFRVVLPEKVFRQD